MNSLFATLCAGHNRVSACAPMHNGHPALAQARGDAALLVTWFRSKKLLKRPVSQRAGARGEV